MGASERGEGCGAGAQLAARASLMAVPALWLVLAALLLEPHSQSLVLWLFTKVDATAPAVADTIAMRMAPLLLWLTELRCDGSAAVGVLSGAVGA